MLCPIDGSPLSKSSREGVEIDFCPKCRGVWLDRGELDKILERAGTAAGGPATIDAGPRPTAPSRPDHREPGQRKRRSFLDELFELE